MKKLYVLHGWSYTVKKWKEFLKILEKNKVEYVLLKIPGLTEKLDRVWTIDDYALWLNEKIGSEPSILLGHSNGGRIALYFSLCYPNLVDKLILIDSAGIYHREFFLQLKKMIFQTLAKAGKKVTISPVLKKLLYRLARTKDYLETSGSTKETMLNLISIDLTNKLEKISSPTLIIWGEKDRITPLSDGRLMSEKIKQAKIHVIKSAKHSPQFTHPEETAQQIISFLKVL